MLIVPPHEVIQFFQNLQTWTGVVDWSKRPIIFPIAEAMFITHLCECLKQVCAWKTLNRLWLEQNRFQIWFILFMKHSSIDTVKMSKITYIKMGTVVDRLICMSTMIVWHFTSFQDHSKPIVLLSNGPYILRTFPP